MSTLDELVANVRQRRQLPPPQMRRAIRVSAGVSLAKVAQTVGVSPQAVHMWERGEREPSGQNLPRYIAVLGALSEVD